MQVHFRLLLIFFSTLVSKLPPYRSHLNPAQSPVAWCLQWPGTRHSIFPEVLTPDDAPVSQSGSGPGSGHYKCLVATKQLLHKDDVNCELIINCEMSARHQPDYNFVTTFPTHINKYQTFEFKYFPAHVNSFQLFPQTIYRIVLGLQLNIQHS